MADPTSVRIDPETQRQLDALMRAWGGNTTNAIIRCIRETYHGEVKRLAALRVESEPGVELLRDGLSGQVVGSARG